MVTVMLSYAIKLVNFTAAENWEAGVEKVGFFFLT